VYAVELRVVGRDHAGQAEETTLSLRIGGEPALSTPARASS
jgi:hypothetical protein